jgi:hypothetical protein
MALNWGAAADALRSALARRRSTDGSQQGGGGSKKGKKERAEGVPCSPVQFTTWPARGGWRDADRQAGAADGPTESGCGVVRVQLLGRTCVVWLKTGLSSSIGNYAGIT